MWTAAKFLWARRRACRSSQTWARISPWRLTSASKIPRRMTTVKASCDRTVRWLARCKAEIARLNALPDTVNPAADALGHQPGRRRMHDLRVEHMQQIAELDLPGYAIGGLAVGRDRREDHVRDHRGGRALHAEGQAALSHGRRNAVQYHRRRGPGRGLLRLRDARPQRPARPCLHLGGRRSTSTMPSTRADERPIDPDVRTVPSAAGIRRAYLRHLFKAEEMLAHAPCGACTISISTTN